MQRETTLDDVLAEARREQRALEALEKDGVSSELAAERARPHLEALDALEREVGAVEREGEPETVLRRARFEHPGEEAAFQQRLASADRGSLRLLAQDARVDGDLARARAVLEAVRGRPDLPADFGEEIRRLAHAAAAGSADAEKVRAIREAARLARNAGARAGGGGRLRLTEAEASELDPDEYRRLREAGRL